MTDNCKKVLKFLQEQTKEGSDLAITNDFIGKSLGMQPRSVVGTLNALANRIKIKPEDDHYTPLIARSEIEVELEDGTHKKVKEITLTSAGAALDVDAM